MAGAYAELIRSIIWSGRVILGGWSLGGLISLQVAKLLEHDPDITISGIIMMDSVFPDALQDAAEAKIATTLTTDLLANCPAETRLAVHRSFAQSARLMSSWTPPLLGEHPQVAKTSTPDHTDALATLGTPDIIWPSPHSETSGLSTSSHSPEAAASRGTPPWPGIATSSGKHSPLGDYGADDLDKLAAKLDARLALHLASSSPAQNRRVGNRPVVILLRASEAVPQMLGAAHPVDKNRADRDLGWGCHCPDLFARVVDVPGHHYNLFARENVEQVSRELRNACNMIEWQ